MVAGVAAGVVLDPEARRTDAGVRSSSTSARRSRSWPHAWETTPVGHGWTATRPLRSNGCTTGRKPLYLEVADLVLDVDGVAPDVLAARIVEAVSG